MDFDLQLEHAACLETLLVLALGVSGIATMAALGERMVRLAMWQRTLWQAATLALVALVSCELLGAGEAVTALWEVVATRPGQMRADAEELGAPWAGSGQGATEEIPQGEKMEGLLAAQDPSPPPPLPQGERGDSDADAARGPQAERGDSDADAAQAGSSLSFWCALIWLGGTGILLLRIVVVRGRLVCFARRQRVVVDAGLRETIMALAGRLGMRRFVFLMESPPLQAPAAFGVLRPTIALPAGFAGQFDDRQQRAILAHELAHLAAWDSLWLLAADLACALLWWHPAAWWSRRRLRAACETAADEASLLVPDGPDVLAGCLVNMGRRLVDQPSWAWLSMGGPRFRSGLGRRVERLLDLTDRPQPVLAKGRMALAKMGLLVVFVFVAVFSTAWARPQAPIDQGETKMNVLSLSWRRSLAAVAVAGLLGSLSGQAMAGDEPKKDPPAAEAKETPHPDQPAADRERADRDHPEARERRDGDRPRDAREGRPERRRVEVEVRKSMRDARPDAGPREGGDRGPRMESLLRERRTMEERIQAIERELRELGPDHPKVQQLKGELDAIQKRLQQAREGDGRYRFAVEGRFDGPNADAMRRLVHLRIAAENLRAAGMEEQADNVMREAEKIQREHNLPPGRPGMMGPPEGRRPGREGPPEGRRPGPPEGPPSGGSGMGPGRPMPEMGELRDQLQQMRREVEELRTQLRKLNEREEQKK